MTFEYFQLNTLEKLSPVCHPLQIIQPTNTEVPFYCTKILFNEAVSTSFPYFVRIVQVLCEGYSGPSWVSSGKEFVCAPLKENMANHILLESLINVDFGKKYINCRFLEFHKRKSQATTKMTICHPIELIGYQIQAH